MLYFRKYNIEQIAVIDQFHVISLTINIIMKYEQIMPLNKIVPSTLFQNAFLWMRGRGVAFLLVIWNEREHIFSAEIYNLLCKLSNKQVKS